MKVAIPIFGSRVSPRFDCAQVFFVVTVNGGCETERRELTASTWTPRHRIQRLVELGVDVVVCGGIDTWSADSLRSAGINVRSQVVGEVNQVLNMLLHGDCLEV